MCTYNLKENYLWYILATFRFWRKLVSLAILLHNRYMWKVKVSTPEMYSKPIGFGFSCCIENHWWLLLVECSMVGLLFILIPKLKCIKSSTLSVGFVFFSAYNVVYQAVRNVCGFASLPGCCFFDTIPISIFHYIFFILDFISL